MSIGDIVSELRKDKGLQQKDLAEKLCVVQTTISNYETNTVLPDADKLVILAEIFDVSVDYLLGRVRTKIDQTHINSVYLKSKGKNLILGDIMKRMIELDCDNRKLLVQYLEFLEFQRK